MPAGKQFAKSVRIAYDTSFRPSGGMADAGDLKSPARNGRVGSTPTSAILYILVIRALRPANVRDGRCCIKPAT